MTLIKPLVETVRDYAAWATSDHPRVPTGYHLMDSRTGGGASLGEVILFQARSGVGKTAFACNVVVNNLGRPTVFFSLEMHGRYIAARLAAMHTGVPTHQIEEDLKVHGRSDALAQLVDDFPYFTVPDKPSMSTKDMGRALQEAEDLWGVKPELVVIDFMELIGGVPSLSTVDKIDGLARKIKDFAREHDVVVLLLHQVKRGEGDNGDKPLSITSSRYGGEVSADYVLGAYRPCLREGITQDQYLLERWWFYLQFLKTRGGPEIHPQGELHQLNPFTLRLRWPYPQEPLFAPDDREIF